MPLVKAPTLLIVGGRDYQVIEMNREALAQLRCEKHLEIVPGATHLFEEPGTLEEVARLAAAWFVKYLSTGHQSEKQRDATAKSRERMRSYCLPLPGTIRQ